MARGINKVILIGNLGDDVKLRRTEGGTAVTTISIATSDVWVDKATNEQKENTEWHDVVLWRNLAENADKYLKKGSKVYVEGQLQTRKWQDKEGHARKTTEIIARDLQFLDMKDVIERDFSLSEEEKSSDDNLSSNPDEAKDLLSEDIPSSDIDDDKSPIPF